MLQFKGSVALSDFRKQKIVQQLNKVVPHCFAVEARFLHFVNLFPGQSLDDKETSVIQQLLDYGHGVGVESSKASPHSIKRIAVPRIGTISPWATKATDISHHCGLTKVHRVERGISWDLYLQEPLTDKDADELDQSLSGIIFDPMIESCLDNAEQAEDLFHEAEPAPLLTIDILGGGRAALDQANQDFGFALSEPELVYLVEQFSNLERNPTDVELMMFAQVNSEHCRHKIFNADWEIDGEQQSQSLFSMIRTTHQKNPKGTIVAYKDNAAILEGQRAARLQPSADSKVFHYQDEVIHFTAKVETHNHPTAISPFPGASTGSGGEIRDEGATGRGGKPKAGLAGFSVSHLRLPGFARPWELAEAKPDRIASPLQIMLEGPIGAVAFNNEFGRPNICGYFRTFEQQSEKLEQRHGYHKPIMLAGGVGTVRPGHVEKNRIPTGASIIVLGGPTMLIGLGGGAASSVTSGSSSEALDFASVQRGNPEMQRRCQEVIDACCAMGDENPIVSIHDVGAGGLCNALPELVHDADRGGRFELREVLNDEPGMSPMQVWCNESQERYVLAVDPVRYVEFEEICERERCLFARVGVATENPNLILTDNHFDKLDQSTQKPIDLSMDLLFGLPPKMQRNVVSRCWPDRGFSTSGLDLLESWHRVLCFPAVADKTFLVTIGDRSVGGLIARDQMVGPWQVPVADVAVTSSGYQSYTGEAMAIGERTPIAIIDAPTSGRMAIGEALTNLVASLISGPQEVKLSANWMVPAGEPGVDAALYRTVQSVAMDLCPALGVSIPVGKDSMSMATRWQRDGIEQKVVSPLSLVVTAFARVKDIRKTLTPQLRLDRGDSEIWLLDLGARQNRLGGSVIAQVYNELGSIAPDVDSGLLKAFLRCVIKMNQQGLLIAYHDRSDGGLATTLSEMCFAGRCGLDLDVSSLGEEVLAAIFNEELGAVVQVGVEHSLQFKSLLEEFELSSVAYRIGKPVQGSKMVVRHGDNILLDIPRSELHRIWSEVSWQMQTLRDNPECALQEYDRILDLDDPGIHAALTFDPEDDVAAPYLHSGARPRIAILREQGVNGQLEMAAAFDRAGFEAVDVTMSDLADGLDLSSFRGFAACGGFSFGDVLGAGEGWAKSILFNNRLRDYFNAFFERDDSFALGVCNGCQMMSTIRELIPGASNWPKFVRNASEQYEARFVTVTIESDRSILLRGMKDSSFAVSVAHGEGRPWFYGPEQFDDLDRSGGIAMRFVDNYHRATEQYPLNPNGSPGGITGLTNNDGRFTIMMPHPERVFRSASHSWHPDQWGENSPWMRLFQNARSWVENG